ncbi:hypothetical protein BG004_000377 [Podila humilis]|nr:hypothetical protein BG004_000377 [Podila humilis]
MSSTSPIVLPATVAELEAIAQNVVTLLQNGADKVVAVPEDSRKVETTLLALQEAQNEAAYLQSQCTFPAMVHLDKDVRVASTEAKKLLQKAWSSSEDMDTITRRLLEHTLCQFKRHGSALSQEGQEKLMSLRSEIASKELDFQTNLNEDTTEILLTAKQLEGCSEAWLSGLKTIIQEEDGQVYYKVTTKTPDILNVSKSASLPSTRKLILTTYRQVCNSTNGPILEELIQLRHEAAQLLGYKNHAAYQLDSNNSMAKTVENVERFLETISSSIGSKLESDREELLGLKKAEYARRGWDHEYDGELYSYDIKYYQEMLFKEKYAVDNNRIQEFFPLEYVRNQILGIYSHIFQLRFQQIPGKFWADDVTLFAVYDQKAQDRAGEEEAKDPEKFKIGYFYFDLFPRAGKYAHQCVVPLRPSFVNTKTGEQVLPIAVNVGNLSRPSASRPALLKHSEIITFFHEFGHVCHAMSNKARHSLFNFSWSVVPYPTSLPMDFLEVPSIMLENWLWEPAVLRKLSKHYETGDQLPEDIIKSLTRTRKVSAGLQFSQQIAITSLDLKVHVIDPSERKLTIAEMWKEGIERVVGIKVERGPGVNQACQFYHIAMGYDAGYYVYAWSEMHAHDLFSRFATSNENENKDEPKALDSMLGREYWDKILVPGAAVDAIDLLRDFLGREPNPEAFQRFLTEP